MATSKLEVDGTASGTSGNKFVELTGAIWGGFSSWETTSPALALNSFNVDGGLLITCGAATF
ncbi:MAG: hypothetical protein HOF72_11080 [Planctomycetaceae bacterium]|nr:hypothetical protein [Planctomycetaceae bacterium]